MDPRDPTTDRRVAEVSGGGWNIADFSTDGRTALVVNRMSINRSVVYVLNLVSGALTPVTDPDATVSWMSPEFGADGAIWVTSDKDADFLRLGKLDAAIGDFTAVSGFLYQPDPAKFPGKRPLIMDIHGGPEGQTRPGFLGADNYMLTVFRRPEGLLRRHLSAASAHTRGVGRHPHERGHPED